jgi:hypothetical protein
VGRCLIGTHAFKQNITGGAFEALAAATGDALSIPNFIQRSRAPTVTRSYFYRRASLSRFSRPTC